MIGQLELSQPRATAAGQPLRVTWGVVRRAYPSPVAAAYGNPASAAHAPRAALRNEIDAQALHALAANGFGDAAVGRAGAYAHLSAAELGRAARAHRSAQLAAMLAAALRGAAALVRRTVARWKQRQLERATYETLQGLDTRTLRDLGFHRSELMSVAAEVAGTAEFTRARLLQEPNGRHV